jgi:hypothetical protein
MLGFKTIAKLPPCATVRMHSDHCNVGSDHMGGSTYYLSNNYRDKRVRVTFRKSWRCDGKVYDEDEVVELPAGGQKSVGCNYKTAKCNWRGWIVDCEVIAP